MFKAFLAAALVLLFGLPCGAAMTNEPKDFRGVVFGQEYTPGPEFTCEEDSEEGRTCVRAHDELKLLDVPLRSLKYLFMDKRLYTVDLEVDGRSGYDALLAALARRHGRNSTDRGGMTTFTGTSVDIIGYFDARHKIGEVSFVFRNLPCPVGE